MFGYPVLCQLDGPIQSADPDTFILFFFQYVLKYFSFPFIGFHPSEIPIFPSFYHFFANYSNFWPFIDQAQSVYKDFYAANDWAEDLVARINALK